MQQKFRALSQKAKSVILNYPLVLAMALTMTSAILYMIETNLQPRENFFPMRIVITSGLGISLMFAVKMLSQRIGRELLLQGIGITVLICYFLLLPATEAEFTEMYAFVIVPAVVLSHLLVAFIPFTGKRSEINFWQYNKNLFINIVLTAIFTGVLTGGVELAILSVDQLFSMDFDGDRYVQTFTVLGIAGSVFIFLLFNEGGLAYLESDGDYPVVLKFFTQFILIPLLSLYVIILYFYAVKILLNWELPEGWVSYLVLAYSIVGILALLLVHPLKGDTTRSWVRIFSGIFYFSLLPLIVLLFVAIFTRVLQYGFTEPRYYVLLLAIWLLLVVLYFIFNKRATIKFIPMSLFALGLFSLVFPYFNTFSVSRRSQKQELQQLLTAHNILTNNKINFDTKIPADVAQNISDKFNYLNQRFEGEFLGQFLDSISKKNLDTKRYWSIDHLFTNKVETDNAYRSLHLNNSQAFYDVSEFQYVIRQGELYGEGVKLGDDLFKLRVETSKNPMYILKINDQEIDLLPELKSLLNQYRGSEGILDADSLSVEHSTADYRIRIVFKNLNQDTYNEEVTYDFSDGLIMIQKK